MNDIVNKTELDPQQTLVNLINEMSKIRLKGINSRKVDDKVKDRYLVLTRSLAAEIQGVGYEPLANRVKSISKTIRKDEDLLNYDPVQDGYWRRKEKDFVRNLDELLIGLVGDELYTLDDTHHVLQAIKYLTVAGGSIKEKEQVYDTILPFNKALPVKKASSLSEKLFAPIFGEKCKAENLDDFTLRVDGILDYMDAVLEEAKNLGYMGVVIQIHEKEFDKFKAKYAGAIVPPNQQFGRKSEKENRFSKFVGGLIKYTGPISYPIIGGLPVKIRERINNIAAEGGYKVDQFKQEFSNVGVELVSGATLGVVASNPFLVIGGSLLVVQTVARLVYGIKNKEGIYPAGLQTKVALLPIEMMMNDIEFKTYTGKDSVMVLIPIERNFLDHDKAINPARFYENMTKLSVPSNVERNLVWNPENHNCFGKEFVEYIDKNIAKNVQVNCESHIERQNQFVVYRDAQMIGNYSKNSHLYFFNSHRYLVTTIADSKKYFSKTFDEIILKDPDILQFREINNLQGLVSRLGANYIRIKHFKNGQEINDYEAVR